MVLFHVTPEATWSNLPISGSFVDMLRRIVQLSRNQGQRRRQCRRQRRARLPPYRMIAANGTLVPPTPDARPLAASAGVAPVTIENPPGLYGSEDGVVAHNLLGRDAALAPLARPRSAAPVTELRYALDESRDLQRPLLTAALVADGCSTRSPSSGWAACFRAGRVAPRAGRRRGLRCAGCARRRCVAADPARAQDSKPGDAEAVEAISTTRLAYVVTGDAAIDAISRPGLAGLTAFLIEKTALEPAEPAGVDIAKDELAFYPLIYWPVDADARQCPRRRRSPASTPI